MDAGLRQEWERLAAAADNVFSTPEWAEEWLRHVGPRHTLLEPVAAGRVVRAVLPLVVSRVGPLRVARFVGHGPADELGPVCAPEDRPLAAGALLQSSRDHRVDVLLARRASTSMRTGPSTTPTSSSSRISGRSGSRSSSRSSASPPGCI